MAKATSNYDLNKRQHLDTTSAQMKVERTSFDSHWRDLSDYILPRRTRFFASDRNKGDRRTSKIIDSTGRLSARTLQSGMHSGISSPARPWMKLTTPDPDLAEFGPVKEWLYTVTQRMLTVFLRSNLYNALPVIYGDAGTFATAACGVLEDDREVMRCYPYPLGTYWLGLSRRQTVDTFYREYQMTVRQVVEDFVLDPDQPDTFYWERCSKTVKTLWDQHNLDSVLDVMWFVGPNAYFHPEKLDVRYAAPWMSVWWERGADGGQFLRESGFNEFPILAPRWDVAAEDIYGTDCPGMTVLPDVKMLQTMQRRKAQAIEKMVNPPLQGPSNIREKVSLIPGDFTAVDVTQAQQGIKPIHEITMSVNDIRVDIIETQNRIREGYYADLWAMLAQSDRPQMTAREVAERHEEKLLLLGPVLERMNDELLDPLVDRVYGMMERRGMIPDPPEELNGVALKVEYTSIMAQAQKLVGVVALDRFFASVMPIAETFTSARFKVNAKEAVNEYGDALGVSPKIIIPDEDADRAMQAQAQAMAQQQQMEQAALAAKAGRDLGNTPTGAENDNALSRILSGVQG